MQHAVECFDEFRGPANVTEEAIVFGDHFQSHRVIFVNVGSATIRNTNAEETPVVRLAYRGANANFRGFPANQKRLYPPRAQHAFHIRRVETSLTGFVNDWLAGYGVYSSGMIPCPSSPRTKIRPRGPEVPPLSRPDRCHPSRSLVLVRVQVRTSPADAPPRVYDEHAQRPSRRQ